MEGRVRLENGEEVTRRYLKGKLLGKVSSSVVSGQRPRSRRFQPDISSSCLVQGGFAKCYLATCVDTGEQYALKVVSKASLQKSSARQRVRVRAIPSQPIHLAHLYIQCAYVHILQLRLAHSLLLPFFGRLEAGPLDLIMKTLRDVCSN